MALLNSSSNKTDLFYAVQQSSNESVVSELIAGGADVNRTDNEGKTALFYAVQQSNNESVVRVLIDAGTDVTITDNEGKTALFYAVQDNNERVVRALIEHGKSLTSPRDIYGRTPLFYAMTKSQSITCYLLEKKVNMRIIDKCGMSFLSFFVDHCISNSADSNESCISERIDLIVQKGVKGNTVYVAIMNIIFCKCPLLFHSGINVPIFIFFLELAKTYSTKHERNIDKILEKVRKTVNDKTLIPQILYSLCELGADPNSADTEGNTALHHAVCLPFYGVSNEAIMDLLKKLEKVGVTFDAKNHQSETPLLFCLTWHSNDQQILDESKQLSSIKILVEVCEFLINNGSNVEETTKKEDSVLHLIMRLLQKLLEWHESTRLKDAFQVGIELFMLFSSTRAGRRVIHKKDENLNSPIHLWASLEPPQQCLRDVANEGSVFSDFMKEILNKLLECGAQLDELNKLDQTPLHLCRTWTAVELLLIDFEANPNVVDVLGRSPLIVAAERSSLLKTKKASFYDDVVVDPKAFWKTALERGLDPWTVDKHGNSVLRYLIESEAVDLAKAMIDVFCANKKDFPSADETTNTCTILNIICKDNKNEPWKQEYVEKILQLLGRPLFEIKWSKTSPLHLCCRNIIEASKEDGSSVQTTVHWDIAELLLLYKADRTILNETGQSCLDIAEECSELKELLKKQLNPEQVPNLTKWKPERCVAKRYLKKLEEVSKFNNCEKLDQSRIWFHKEHIAKGSFGCRVFAGINVEDGMEVAIKRICKTKKKYEHEICNLVKLSSVDRQQIVSYNRLVDHDNCIYVILELMEGTLTELLKGKSVIKAEERKSFWRQLLKGVQNMHETGIIHRHLRPSNILIYNRPAGQRQLKIAGFGRSLDIKSPFPAKHEDDIKSKCWSAPEVLSCSDPHSKESDMFSCGLVLHYIELKKNPYESQNHPRTVKNITNGRRNEWDLSLCPERVQVLESVLERDKKKRSTANELLGYPFFWSDDKKIIFLRAVSDEEKGNPSGVHQLECRFKDIVKCKSWDMEKHNRVKIPEILSQMNSMAKKQNTPVFYHNGSVRGLLRLIRNAHAHIVELTRSNEGIGKLVRDHVFLKYFPDLVVEVFKAIKLLKWDEKKPEIRSAIKLH